MIIECMMLRSTKSLEGSESDQAVNWYEMRTELSHPTHAPLEN